MLSYFPSQNLTYNPYMVMSTMSVAADFLDVSLGVNSKITLSTMHMVNYKMVTVAM